MKQLILASALAAAIAVPASSAFATPFYIEAGSYGLTTGPGTDADTRTNAIDSLGWTDTLATSIYYGLTPGSTVVDTNDKATLSGLGIPLPIDPDQRRIVSLNPYGGPLGDTEGFNNTPAFWGTPMAGGTLWGMTYTYTLEGTINAAGTGVDFHTGTWDIFFEDGTSSTQVLRLILTDFNTTDAGSTYTTLAHGNVDYSWTDGSTSDFVKNFFVDEISGRSFYDLWFNGGELNPVAVGWRMDGNIDCPPGQQNCQGVPLQNQLSSIEGWETGGYRQTTLDGTLRFNVPEPGSLALLGLGLTGLGVLRRRKNA